MHAVLHRQLPAETGGGTSSYTGLQASRGFTIGYMETGMYAVAPG